MCNRCKKVEMENRLKINAGRACKDRTNEVEPRPNTPSCRIRNSAGTSSERDGSRQTANSLFYDNRI